jgi:hypothetical protein
MDFEFQRTAEDGRIVRRKAKLIVDQKAKALEFQVRIRGQSWRLPISRDQSNAIVDAQRGLDNACEHARIAAIVSAYQETRASS